VLEEYVRDGNGPNESKNIDFAALKNEYLYLKESNGQLSRLNIHTGKIDQEKIALTDRVHFFHFYNDFIILSTKLLLNPTALDSDKRMTVGYIVNVNNFSMVDTLKISFHDTELNNVSRLKDLRGLLLNNYVIMTNNNRFYYTFEGSRQLLKYNDQGLEEVFNVTMPGAEPICVVNDGAYGTGLRMLPTFSNVYIDNSSDPGSSVFGLSFGSSSSDVEFGYVEFDFSEDSFRLHHLIDHNLTYFAKFAFKKSGSTDMMFSYERGFKNFGEVFISNDEP
jgi:hypothetical protein